MRKERESFLNHLATQKGFSSNTVEAYRNDLSQLASYIEEQAVAKGYRAAWSSVDRNLLIGYILDLKERGYRPATIARKVVGILGGFIVLQFLNVLRIAGLGLTGIYLKEYFHYIHVYVAQGMMIAVALVLFLVWLNYVTEK